MAKKRLGSSTAVAKSSDSKVRPKKDDWKQEVISFAYRGRNYKAKIEGHLVLDDMSLVEIKDRLNEIPGKFAFWKNLQVAVDRELEDLGEDYNLWFARKYQDIMEVGKKLTETAIKNLVLLNNAVEYRLKRLAIKDLRDISSKIGVLTKAYDMQSWTLRAIANLTAQEIGNIEARGKRSLKDL